MRPMQTELSTVYILHTSSSAGWSAMIQVLVVTFFVSCFSKGVFGNTFATALYRTFYITL